MIQIMKRKTDLLHNAEHQSFHLITHSLAAARMIEMDLALQYYPLDPSDEHLRDECFLYMMYHQLREVCLCTHL